MLLVAAFFPQNSRRIEPTKFAPGAFFNTKCAMCHGENGSGYRTDLARGMTEAKLETRLVEMTDGQARSPLANKDLAVLKAWFRGFLKKEPFVAWTQQSGSVLTFETVAGGTLTATVNGRAVTVSGGKLTLPTGATPSQVEVTAKRGEAKTVLKLASASMTHTAALK
jgi:hypothetical protein